MISWWMPAFSVFLGLLMLGAFLIGDEPGTGFASLGIMTALGAVGGLAYIVSVAVMRART